MLPAPLTPKTSSRPSALLTTSSMAKLSPGENSNCHCPTHPLLGAVCQVWKIWPPALIPKISSRPSALRAARSDRRLSPGEYNKYQPAIPLLLTGAVLKNFGNGDNRVAVALMTRLLQGHDPTRF